MGEKLVTFERNDQLVNSSSDLGFKDIKKFFTYMLTGRKTFTLYFIKTLFLSRNIKIQQKKTSITIFIKK